MKVVANELGSALALSVTIVSARPLAPLAPRVELPALQDVFWTYSGLYQKKKAPSVMNRGTRWLHLNAYMTKRLTLFECVLIYSATVVMHAGQWTRFI
jgi:hypothetical protein